MTASNRTMVLAIILACYLMIIVDISVIITALPDIHSALDFSSAGLSWVQNAYALTFGGLLLLGARAGDILGRRRVFVAGVALFTAMSLLAGLAQSPGWLLGARALQGVGAAIAAPSTLALLTVTFREGTERTRAIAWYSAVAGGGGSLRLVGGGMLTALGPGRGGRRKPRSRARRHAHRLGLVARGPVHQRAHRPRARRAGPALPARDRAQA